MRDYTKIGEKNCQSFTHDNERKTVFKDPCCVTTGPTNQVLIVDNNIIIILDKDLQLIERFGQGNGDSKLNNPRGIAVGDNVIAVSDDHVVKKYSLQGVYQSKFGCYGNADGQFNDPQGLCFNSECLLYVVDSNNHRVQVLRENEVKFTFGSRGSNPGQFLCPSYIAVDSRDRVYVTDCAVNGGICVFSEDGHFIKKIKCYKPYAIGIARDDYIITESDDALTVQPRP